MPDNQPVWMSYNQEVTEETFIQTGRRGRDGQPGQRGRVARLRLMDRVVPHLHADKPGGKLGSETDCATQGSSTGK